MGAVRQMARGGGGWERLHSCSQNAGFRFSSSGPAESGRGYEGRCVTIVSDVASGGRVWGSRFGRGGGSSSEAGLGGRCGRVGWGGWQKIH